MIDLVALDRRAEPLALVCALGFKPARGSRVGHAIVCCPMHADATPSFHVTRGPGGTLRATCFAGCGTVDLIGLTALAHGLDARADFARVAQLAAEAIGVALEHDEHQHGHRTPKESAPVVSRRPLDLDGELGAVLCSLDTTGAVEDFLAARKLLDLARAEGWRFLDRPELRWLIDERVALDGDPFDGPIGSAGLVARGDDGIFIAHPENRLAIFWRAPDGSIDTLQRRRLDGQKGAKYVFAAGRGPRYLYGVERLAGAAPSAELVLVEGAIDVLARRALEGDSGRVVLGLPGTSVWKSEWSALARGRVVRLALDDDDAGHRAADRIAEELFAAGAKQVLRVTPPDANDWAAMLEAGAC